MLEPAKIVELFEKENPKVWAADSKIFEEGETGNLMYGVLEGTVELFVNGEVIERIQKGDVFGEGALVHEEHTRASTAIAKTECKLTALDEERFIFAIQQTPMFAIYVIRSFSDRLRRLKHSHSYFHQEREEE